MAQGKSDGTVYIDTIIDTSGIGKGIETVKNKIGSVSNSVKKFGDYLKKSFTETPTGNAGRAYEEVARDIKKAEAQLDKLIEKQIRFVEIGGNRKSQTFAGMEYDIEMARNKLFELRDELSKTEKKAPKSINVLKKGVDNTTKSIKKMGNTAKKSNFSLLKMLGTSLLFSIVFRAISAVTQGFVDGLNNLVQYSDQANGTMSALKSSMTQLKNSFATAFMPLITIVTPALNKFMQLLIKANTLVAQFLSALTGKKTYTKAVEVQEDYAKSLDKTAESAKKAQKYLTGLDEVRTFTSSDTDKNNEILPKDMFEEVAIDSGVIDFVEKLKEGINNLIPKVKELAGIFKDGFFDGLGDFEPRLKTIKDGFESIKKSIIDIFSDSGVKRAMNRFINSFTYSLGQIIGSLASIGLTLGANLVGGLSKYLNENSNRIKGHLTNMFNIGADISEMFGNYLSSIAYIFESFASENGQQITADLIAIFANAVMGITEIMAQLGRDVIALFTTPIINGKEQIKLALDDLLAGFVYVTSAIKDYINDMVEFGKDVYNTIVSPIFSSLTEKLTSLVQDHISPAISKVGDLFRAIGEALSSFWNGVLQPFISWFINNVLPTILPALETIVRNFTDTISIIVDLLSGLIGTLTGLIDFLTGVFTGDWQKAWDGIKNIVGSIWDSITSIVKTAIDNLKDWVNNLLSLFDKTSSKASKLGSKGAGYSRYSSIYVPYFGNYSSVNIPKLATGAVIPPNAPFMAVLGDQRRGTNIETPEDLLRKVVREESVSGNGGVLHAHLYLDGKEVLTSIIDMAKLEQTSTGINPLLLT